MIFRIEFDNSDLKRENDMKIMRDSLPQEISVVLPLTFLDVSLKDINGIIESYLKFLAIFYSLRYFRFRLGFARTSR